MSKYLVLCANCAHPSGELKFFLATDDNDDTIEFETRKAAELWCADVGSDGTFAYTIIYTGDFHYE